MRRLSQTLLMVESADGPRNSDQFQTPSDAFTGIPRHDVPEEEQDQTRYVLQNSLPAFLSATSSSNMRWWYPAFLYLQHQQALKVRLTPPCLYADSGVDLERR